MNRNLEIITRQTMRWRGVPLEQLSHVSLLLAFREVAMHSRMLEDELVLARKKLSDAAWAGDKTKWGR